MGGKEGSPRKRVRKARHHQGTERLDTIWAFGNNLGMTNHPRILDGVSRNKMEKMALVDLEYGA